ncbi:MAG: methyltransferase domain-containing protein [Acidobacteriota bacterium]
MSGTRTFGIRDSGFGIRCAVWVCVCLILPPAAPFAQERPRHGRLFPPRDLGLLEGPDRDLWQMPGQIMDALGIAEGSVVGDIGGGGGWFTMRLAIRVGPNGFVYAEDIQHQMLEATRRRVAREGRRNVETVLGTSDDPKLPAGQLDAVLIVDTYHEFENPVPMLRNTAAALRPGGRLGIVEYKMDGLGPGPPLEERVDPEQVIRDATAAGLTLFSRETFLPFQFFLVFVRGPDAGGAVR